MAKAKLKKEAAPGPHITKQRVRSIFEEYLLITLGSFIVTVGIYFFKFPNNFVTGGVAGLSVVLNRYMPEGSIFTPSMLMTIMNILLLIVGFIFLGRDFGFKTVYSTILISGLSDLFDLVGAIPFILRCFGREGCTTLTDQPFLELFFAVILPAIGSAVLFYVHASSGGTDVIAMIIHRYTQAESGRALLYSDIVITFGAFLISFETAMFSIFGLVMKSLVIDNVMETINQSKYFLVITTHKDEVADFINNKLHRGATAWETEGTFTHEKKYAIVTVMKKPQGFRLREYVKSVDPQAFVIISNTSDIIGKGFRELD